MKQWNDKALKHIAIAGNIGAGKTTLTTQLGDHFNWVTNFEDVIDNPYLGDFYNDMKRWAFNLQVYFLSGRYQQILDIRKGEQTVIQDRTIYEDACIFAPNLHDMSLMSTRDFNNYTALFENMKPNIAPPDLLIYLRASIPALVNNISTRGRDYENSISIDYLKRLNERYEDWVKNYTEGNLLIINVDNMDFKNNLEDLNSIINSVSEALSLSDVKK